MFEHIRAIPEDPILGMNDAFLNDLNPKKINLSVGVYKDEQGTTPILKSVKEAEKRLLQQELTKSYLSIEGTEVYRKAVQTLLFGKAHNIVIKHLAQTVHTPGGTGALRIAAECIKKLHAEATIWVSDPTWANHQAIFQSVGLKVNNYAYYNTNVEGLDFEALIESLSQVSPGDVVLFHGCCHNPTGIDPTPEQWYQLARICSKRGLLPLFDIAYQGFGRSLEEDTKGLHIFLEYVPEMLIANSFSKNFGLYNERVGALTILCETAEQAKSVLTQIKHRIRTNYSNPPYHGSAIVAEILINKELRTLWETELATMRLRIHEMRSLFVNTLQHKGLTKNFSFISKQLGIFSFSGLNAEQVNRLRKNYGIYIIESGRINIAGITHENVEQLCEAICTILKS